MSKKMHKIQPKKKEDPLIIKVDPAHEAGKAYRLDFKTGAHEDKKNNPKRKRKEWKATKNKGEI